MVKIRERVLAKLGVGWVAEEKFSKAEMKAVEALVRLRLVKYRSDYSIKGRDGLAFAKV